MIKVSVIVPIYNAGHFLRKCLDTIVNQTLKEIEIILVLDCPTDGSDKIAEEYAQRDNRIKLIFNKENLHVGLSRNKGLEIATGEYITFSDHDDYRELNMYEELYKQAKKEDSDIVLCSPIISKNEQIEIWEMPQIDSKIIREYCLLDLLGRGNYTHAVSHFCYIHNSLYKHNLLADNNIQFIDTRLMSPEDVIFQIQTIYFSNKVSFCYQSFYYHILHEQSEGHTYSYGGWQKRGAGMNFIYEFLQEQKCYEVYEVNFLLQVKKQFLNSLLGLWFHKKDIVTIYKAFKALKAYPFTSKAFSNYSYDVEHRSLLKRKIRAAVSKALAI